MSNAVPNTAPIGIFDSGVGGLTVARAIIDQLPGEQVRYVGDTANGPYGPLPIAEVRRHALAIGDRLVDSGVKMLVIACNTASAACLADARERYDVPVVEVIRPAVRRAVAVTRTGEVGVIGTSATIASGAYQDAFDAAAGVHVHAVACPSFVDFVERGITSGRQVVGLAQAYLAPLQRVDLDTLVLVSSAEETAKDVYRRLTEAELLSGGSTPPAPHEFLATGDPEPFARLGQRFLGPEISVVSELSLAVSP